MFFIIQKEKYKDLDMDNILLRNLLERERYTHEYTFMSLNDFYDSETNTKPNKDNYPKYLLDAIPLGTIEFVSAYFNVFYNIEKINPIEIPLCLRTYEFLKREYSIVGKNEIPKEGQYFIKDVSQLKVFSYNGNMEYFLYNEIFDKPKNSLDTRLHLNPDHLYQISETVNILSEYRVYILDGQIYSIANYDGDPTIFPDIKLINKANLIYSIQPDYPKSYTIDIMITDRGTAIIELHILFSTGLYNTVLGTNFLYGYRDAKDYVTNLNTLIKK